MNSIRTDAESSRWLVRLLALASLLACAIAVRAWLYPSLPPYQGRLSWVASVAFSLAGPLGIAALWLGAALVLALIARFVWRHTSKLPSDRWL